MKWFYYKIDYEYGFAYLWTRKKPKNPINLFYDLANQCFGIRKSIGETKLLEEGEQEPASMIEMPKTPMERHPDIYDNPLSRIMGRMTYHHEIPKDKLTKANYILIHSGGDLIMWTRKNHKIQSEWDD